MNEMDGLVVTHCELYITSLYELIDLALRR
jgi:hypothetical protein